MIARMDTDGSGLEIEVKLALGSPAEAKERLGRLPAVLEDERRFEDNEVFDTPDGRLKRAGSMLRLRIVERDGRMSGVVTFKERVETGMRAKVRAEVQTMVASPVATREIISKLGFVRVYRYQKYRSYFGWSDPESGAKLSISLDDTPIGLYIELEGEKIAIDRAAGRMGFAENDYIVEDYRALHRAWLERRGLPAGDMVFP
jgi:adenylate cyclase, class 2